jgi:hypothetical protein
MKKSDKIFRLMMVVLLAWSTSCSDQGRTSQKNDRPQKDNTLIFTSSDAELTASFNWAKQKALSYVGDSNDPVGPWYEAALPQREAFCMRDVSHQCIAAEYLGLHEQNRNMMHLFVKNISESKDWCSYWEINRYNKPAPADYRNDKEFWYNLPANFDVIQACYRLYMISGDKTFIEDKDFMNFYERSVNEYIARWHLMEDELLTRERYINTPEPFNEKDPFHYAHGLPSYIEGGKALRIGSDMVASIYAGLTSYAKILQMRGEREKAEVYLQKSETYREHLYKHWWDKKDKTYFSYYTMNDEFRHSEPATFMLWFDAVKDTGRLNDVLNDLASKTYNVENTSYLPYLFYKHGRDKEAYQTIKTLTSPGTKRRDYPEVSYGVIHGFIEGMFGIRVDAVEGVVSVKPNLIPETKWVQLEGLGLLSATLTVRHTGDYKTEVTNTGKKPVKIRFCFDDKYESITINGKKTELLQDVDNGNICHTVECKPGEKLTAVAE